MLDIKKAEEAAQAHHKWFMEEATPEEQKAFLDKVCRPEPGDYYDEEGVRRAWERRQKMKQKQKQK